MTLEICVHCNKKKINEAYEKFESRIELGKTEIYIYIFFFLNAN